MNTVKLDTGYISGTVIGDPFDSTQGKPGKEVRIYRGIPYAAPPAGDLRWKAPQPVASWAGIRECTVFSKVTPQAPALIPGMRAPTTLPQFVVPQSENCLYLNVLTPAITGVEKLPVMVWMHGGGFIFGSGNDLIFNGPRLPQHGVVLVNVNMRLGPFGLLAHSLLSHESPDGVSGNYMFLDMVAALKWVQKNIAAFGGDPGNVTIFGESGGSAKVLTLMASPVTGGLFHRVIAESGNPGGKPMKELEAMGEMFFDRLGVAKDNDPLKAARALPWEKIMEVERVLLGELRITGRGGLWDMAIDGRFVPENPIDIFTAGKQHRIDYILGANAGELPSGIGVRLIPDYLRLFSGAVKTGVKAYAYIFDQVPAGWKQEGCPSVHAMELPYVFGDWDNKSGLWSWLFGVASAVGVKTTDPGLTNVDRKVSEAMMTIWTQFAKTGNPSVEGLATWPAYESATDRYLYISENTEARTGFSNVGKK